VVLRLLTQNEFSVEKKKKALFFAMRLGSERDRAADLRQTVAVQERTRLARVADVRATLDHRVSVGPKLPAAFEKKLLQ